MGKKIVGDIVTAQMVILLSTGEISAPGMIASFGLGSALPVLAGVATIGVTATHLYAHFSEQQCLKIVERMNEVAEKQSQPAQSLQP